MSRYLVKPAKNARGFIFDNLNLAKRYIRSLPEGTVSEIIDTQAKFIESPSIKKTERKRARA
jgi:hypothetical protein